MFYHLGNHHPRRQPLLGDPLPHQLGELIRQRGESREPAQELIEFGAGGRRLKLPKLGEKQMEVVKVKVARIPQNRATE